MIDDSINSKKFTPIVDQDMKTALFSRDLRYHLFPGNSLIGNTPISLHNQSYQFWQQTWSGVFKELGTGEAPNPDDFMRQDRISAVTYRDSVIALHLYSFFDLDSLCAQEHSYFQQSFTQVAIDAMRAHGAKTAMSFEYFTLAEQWRGRNQGLSIAPTLLDIGLRLFAELGADIALGICRVDIGVAKMCYNAGGIPLDKGLQLHGVPCDLVGILQGSQKPHSFAPIRELAEQLWVRRADYSPAIELNRKVPAKAA